MSTVVEELSELESKRAAAYEQAVKDLVDGRQVAAEELDRLCREQGKTARELSSEVEARKRIKAQRADVARMDGLAVERAELQSQIEQANVALEQRVSEHQATCAPLQFQISNINQELMRLSTLKNELAARGR